MLDFVQFNVGDRVVCNGIRSGNRVGQVGTVTHIDDDFVYVRFDADGIVLELYAWRLQSDDGLSPICRKIRIMEKRWANFQQRKANAMA